MAKKKVQETKSSKRTSRPRKKRVFADAVKTSALKRMAYGESATAIAKDIGVHTSLLYYWQRNNADLLKTPASEEKAAPKRRGRPPGSKNAIAAAPVNERVRSQAPNGHLKLSEVAPVIKAAEDIQLEAETFLAGGVATKNEVKRFVDQIHGALRSIEID